MQQALLFLIGGIEALAFDQCHHGLQEGRQERGERLAVPATAVGQSDESHHGALGLQRDSQVSPDGVVVLGKGRVVRDGGCEFANRDMPAAVGNADQHVILVEWQTILVSLGGKVT